MPIHRRPPWSLPENRVTPEARWLDRRRFVAAMGLGGVAAAAGCADPRDDPTPATATADLYPAPRDPTFTVERPVTDARIAARYNNFYEFDTAKDAVWRAVGAFRTRPWSIEVGGRVRSPGRFDVDDLVRRLPLSERIYRFRCVEAWAMVVPWTGFPLSALLALVDPLPEARWVQLVSAHVPAEMPGAAAQTWYPWPYHEALSLAEARNPLTLVATGIYGRELPRQHGAPLRLVVPWKYGFKSIKSLVAIRLVEQPPPTFWNSLAPAEYDRVANVDPRVPHPRWSQATERMIGTGERRPTLLYNGYAPQVAGLYGG